MLFKTMTRTGFLALLFAAALLPGSNGSARAQNAALTILHSFDGTDGDTPTDSLVVGKDGGFYGTTQAGGSDDAGTVYRITPAGGFSVLALRHGLLWGGANGSGVVFRLTLSGVLEFTASAVDVMENADSVTLQVSRASGSTGAVTVRYATADGSAVAGRDYKAASGTLAWADGDTSDKTVVVAILDPGVYGEGTRTFSLNLSAPTGGSVVGANATAGVVITDNDPGLPIIDSAATATGQVGKAFSYQITAVDQPTSYAATGLPAGLGINAMKGLISGTPTAAGTFAVGLSASNSLGTGTATLHLTILSAAPKITSVSPASGPVGTLVHIEGSGFTAPMRVAFGGNVAAVHQFNATEINALVPPGAVTGPITVSTSGGKVATPANFMVTPSPLPTITGVTPGGGPVGATVIIRGIGFLTPMRVAFGGNVAAVHAFTSTQINATVPVGALTGPITITTDGGSVSTATDFQVTAAGDPPTLTGVSPGSGAVGTRVILKGSGFVAPMSVTFGGNIMAVHQFNATQINAIVPAGAVTGPIKVTTDNGTVSTPASFKVTAP